MLRPVFSSSTLWLAWSSCLFAIAAAAASCGGGDELSTSSSSNTGDEASSASSGQTGPGSGGSTSSFGGSPGTGGSGASGLGGAGGSAGASAGGGGSAATGGGGAGGAGGSGGHGGHGGAGQGGAASSSAVASSAVASSVAASSVAASSTASSSVAASSTSSTGGGPSGVVLMIGGGGSSILSGEFHSASGWSSMTHADATSNQPAITLTSATSGIGLIRSTSGAGELRFDQWTPGGFSPFVAISPGVTTRARPALATGAADARAAFQGDDFKHYFALHVATWSPTAEPVGASQSFGPSPPSIAALGGDAVVAFAGSDSDLYDQTRTGGVWQAAHAHGLGNVISASPAIVAMTSSADLMVAFVRSTDQRIVSTTRSGGTWSGISTVDANALSNDPVALAALPGGEAVLAYRGQDGNLYWSRYAPTALPAWTTPAALASPNVATASTPALAAGIDAVDAELVFADATGTAKHARLTGTTWTAPISIGGSGLTRVAVASSP